VQDRSQLGVEHGQPLVLFPHLQQPLLDRVLLHSFVANLMFYGRRQGSSNARKSCLLRSIDGSGPQEVDMGLVIANSHP
jgi:hypothetical protein